MKRTEVQGYDECREAVKAKNDGRWIDVDGDPVWWIPAPDGSDTGLLVFRTNSYKYWREWSGDYVCREDEPRRNGGWVECSQEEAHLGGGVYTVIAIAWTSDPIIERELVQPAIDRGWFYCKWEDEKK